MKQLFYIFIFIIYVNSIKIVFAIDRLAIVDILQVIKKSSKYELVIKRLKNEFDKKNEEIKLLENNLYNNIKNVQKKGSTMLVNIRNEIEKSILIQRILYENKKKFFEQYKIDRQLEENNKTVRYVQKIINNFAIKNNYNLIIDSNSVIYFNKNNKNIKDITLNIKKELK